MPSALRPAANPQCKPSQEASQIPYFGRVFTEDKVKTLIFRNHDFWLTLGSEGEAFQKEIANFL